MGPTEIETQHPIQTQKNLSPPTRKFLAEFFVNNSPNTCVLDAPIQPSPQSSCSSSASASASQRQLRSEALRLATFQGWPLSYLSPRQLAADGFFYCGIGDQTRCAFCFITISQWEPQDVPSDEHRRHAPNCPFVLGLPVGNVPLTIGGQSIGRSDSSWSTPVTTSSTSASPAGVSTRPSFLLPASMTSAGGDVCGSRFQNESRPNALPERGKQIAGLFTYYPPTGKRHLISIRVGGFPF